MWRTVFLITKPGSELLNRFLTSNPIYHLPSRDPRNHSLRRNPLLPRQALDAYSIYPPRPLRLRSQLAFFSSLASFLSDIMEDGAGGFEESWETDRDTMQEILTNYFAPTNKTSDAEQLLVLDSVPGKVNPENSDGEMEQVLDLVKSTFINIVSEMVGVLHDELWIFESIVRTIGSNLKRSGDQETWAFNLEGAVQMSNFYRSTFWEETPIQWSQ